MYVFYIIDFVIYMLYWYGCHRISTIILSFYANWYIVTYYNHTSATSKYHDLIFLIVYNYYQNNYIVYM